MSKFTSNEAGFSMMEALVASLIFSIGVLGVFSTISSQKAPAVESDGRVKAAFFGRQVLEDLRSKVDAVTYDSGDLSVGTHGPFVVGIYTYSYTVSAAGEARKVDLDVTW